MTSEQLELVDQYLVTLIALLIVVLTVVITWFIRVYVRGSTRESEWSAIMTLTGESIKFAERYARDKADERTISGIEKLNTAVNWLIETSEQEGIKKLTTEQATALVQAKFEEMAGAGGIKISSKLPEWVSQAVSVVLAWDAAGQVPPNADRIAHLTLLGANVVEKLALEQRGSPDGTGIPWEQTKRLVQVELLGRLSAHTNGPSNGDRLGALAKEVVAAVRMHQAEGKITVKPGSSVGDIVRELATARMLVRAQDEGLDVDADQIAAALAAAFRE